MTNDSFQENFKATYGFDFAAKVRTNDPRFCSNFLLANLYPPKIMSIFSEIIDCAKDCIEAEFSAFAKNCKKKEGLFKCCVGA